MDIEEYRKQFIDEIRFEAEHEGTDPESIFVEKTLNELEEIGELNDPILSNYCDDSDAALILGREFKKKIGTGMVTTEIMRFSNLQKISWYNSHLL